MRGVYPRQHSEKGLLVLKLLQDESLSLTAIAEQVKLSKERVRQLQELHFPALKLKRKPGRSRVKP